MRHQCAQRPKEGESRIIEKFLLFPKRVNNETRWLERSRIKQKLIPQFDMFSDDPYSGWYLGWIDMEWIND